tara:strand:+ start:3638 stop:3874 length:237 start_codon:yes stop_codon:yes gene_type:complete
MTDAINSGMLQSFMERLERLDDDKSAVSADMKEVFAEAKGAGYDTKIMRKVLKLIKQDKAKRQEEQTLVDLYLQSVEG